MRCLMHVLWSILLKYDFLEFLLYWFENFFYTLSLKVGGIRYQVFTTILLNLCNIGFHIAKTNREKKLHTWLQRYCLHLYPILKLFYSIPYFICSWLSPYNFVLLKVYNPNIINLFFIVSVYILYLQDKESWEMKTTRKEKVRRRKHAL